jgi:uncharacterized MAPEG superfamily protein
MSLPLTYLLWSAALAFAYLVAQATAYRLQTGVDAANSTRDQEPEPNLLTGRATRALRNFQETYPVFIALSVVAIFTAHSGALLSWGIGLWFWARVAYLPAYLMGLSPYRSWIWSVSLVGLVLMFVSLVL